MHRFAVVRAVVVVSFLLLLVDAGVGTWLESLKAAASRHLLCRRGERSTNTAAPKRKWFKKLHLKFGQRTAPAVQPYSPVSPREPTGDAQQHPRYYVDGEPESDPDRELVDRSGTSESNGDGYDIDSFIHRYRHSSLYSTVSNCSNCAAASDSSACSLSVCSDAPEIVGCDPNGDDQFSPTTTSSWMFDHREWGPSMSYPIVAAESESTGNAGVSAPAARLANESCHADVALTSIISTGGPTLEVQSDTLASDTTDHQSATSDQSPASAIQAEQFDKRSVESDASWDTVDRAELTMAKLHTRLSLYNLGINSDLDNASTLSAH
ncbi:unnamed protein product (mitochondrion) [Plasmodiophora brassicae]|uniref:Uncharacterized protein n=1 Tax=Plasmodiophora brassicae TaxID=37360 RepID=A0A0G4ILK9_PLABS|nr:hypothetical protein PBRA_004796 [Plasmodiophora brassicae]SPQ93351.1 unnamed protein product [Plasmodiophora brassicae]